jgi:hypothetical protein
MKKRNFAAKQIKEMRKYNFLWLLLGLLTFASCNNSTDYSNNVLGIYPIVDGYYKVYADQTVDSFTVVSNKSWQAKVSADWMTLDPLYSYRTITSGETKQLTCPIYFNVNTAGAAKVGLLQVTNDDHTVGRPYLQTYWLNITNPAVLFNATTESEYAGAYFTLTTAKDSTGAVLNFQIFAPTATLTTTADWVTPKDSNLVTGTYAVRVKFPANTTGANRQAVFKLTTSNGISNDITVIQKGS